MCGVGGIFSGSGAPVDAAGLRRMDHAMAARGSDAEGLYIDDSVGLIHRRLSILDLSELGNCAMPNEDGSIQVPLNGEIYDWRELRTELLGCGPIFRLMTDSEVLAHSYDQWDDALFAHLRGKFALAIWGQARNRLVLTRDRLGEKPPLLLKDGRRALFTSSINAHLAYDEELLPINQDAVVCCLPHGFIPATHTIWQGIEVFPPAHYGAIGSDGAFSFRGYWNFTEERPKAISVAAAEQEVERVTGESVRRCLDADVPVEVLLSDVVDSSLLAALSGKGGACAS